MARLNAEQFESYSPNKTSSDWLKLRDNGDTARVQFMYHNSNELDRFTVHKVRVGDYERMVDCKRNYDDPIDACPFCAAGYKVEPVVMLSMYDVDSKSIKIWQRGKKFTQKLDALFNRYGDLTKQVFEIERVGAKGSQDTTYEVFPMTTIQAEDISDIDKPEFVGGLILDKTPDEMQIYLDTGDFPNTSNNSSSYEEQPTRRSTSRRGI